MQNILAACRTLHYKISSKAPPNPGPLLGSPLTCLGRPYSSSLGLLPVGALIVLRLDLLCLVDICALVFCSGGLLVRAPVGLCPARPSAYWTAR
mmetsp:Transcript_26486/g.106014  ORF Transcript_26486/g.106014 Transcript_26486/m.106014 type:complete len:94 (-) Transcript_26486:109-390(-)